MSNTCVRNLTILASVTPEIRLGGLKFKVDHVTSPRPFQGRFVISEAGTCDIQRKQPNLKSLRLPARKI